MVDLSSNKDNIGIIIFSGSLEGQHLNDIAVIITFLSRYGIPKKNFNVFVPDPKQINKTAELVQGVSFLPSVNFENSLSSLKFDSILSFITGHGCSHGVTISHDSYLSPFSYVKAIESVQEVKNVILIAGICYAGIFNYWDTINKPYKLCLVGATGLHSSLNHKVEGDILNNIFLYFAAQWFTLQPRGKDVDGDGSSTLMDCFKFAGVKTSEFVLKFRSHWLSELKKNEATLLDESATEMDKDAAKRENEKIMELVYTVQEPWILNANLAREIVF